MGNLVQGTIAALSTAFGGGAAAAGTTATAAGVGTSVLGGLSTAGSILGTVAAGKALLSNPKPPAIPSAPSIPSFASNLSGGRNPSLSAQSPLSTLGGTKSGTFTAPRSTGTKTLLGQ